MIMRKEYHMLFKQKKKKKKKELRVPYIYAAGRNGTNMAMD